MSVDCTIHRTRLSDIDECYFMGLLCAALDTFKDDLPFDIEVSSTKNCKLIPKYDTISWTLKTKLSEIKIICDKLKQKTGSSYLEVFPVPTGDPQTYYLPKQMLDGFMLGYVSLSSILTEHDQENDSQENDNENFKDDWPVDPSFLNSSKFVAGPDDEYVNERNFAMTIPCYLWDLEVNPTKDATTFMEQTVSNMINLFLRDCSDRDHELMKTGEYYLRIFQYQDKKNADRYCYMYLRKIDDCTFQSHKDSLTSVEKSLRACEINYVRTGYFYEFPLTEWNKKCVSHLSRFE